MKTCYANTAGILLVAITMAGQAQTINLSLKWQKTAQVQTIEFAPGDNTLVTGGATGNCYPYQCGQIKLWNSSNGTLIRTIAPYGIGLTNDVDISADGSTIISGNGTAYCYPNGGCVADKPGQFKFSTSGTQLQSLTNIDDVYAISYSPGDTFIAAGTGYNFTGEIRIYNKNFGLIRTLPGHDQEVDGLEFTPDRKYLISGGDDGYVRIWDYKTGAQVRAMYHGDYFTGGTYVNVAVSPNGLYVASAGSGYNMQTKIWRISDGALLQTLNVSGSDGYNQVRFTPDGQFVVSGLIQYSSGWFGRLLFWKVSTGALVKTVTDRQGSPQSGGIRALNFSSSAKNYLAYSVSNQLKVFQYSTSASSTAKLGSDPDDEMVVESLPEVISEAFPNPFTTTTSIRYILPQSQFVSLIVYDNLGKKVAELVHESQDAGSHTVSFDAANLPRGIYFYRLGINNGVETKKLLVE